jgi:hypothetical protein
MSSITSDTINIIGAAFWRLDRALAKILCQLSFGRLSRLSKDEEPEHHEYGDSNAQGRELSAHTVKKTGTAVFIPLHCHGRSPSIDDFLHVSMRSQPRDDGSAAAPATMKGATSLLARLCFHGSKSDTPRLWHGW